MSGHNKSPKRDQHSIKYKWSQHEKPSLEAEADPFCGGYSTTIADKENRQCYKNSRVKSPEVLSTAQLISAIGQICDSASRPFLFFHPKENLNQDAKGFQNEKILDNFGEERIVRAYTSTNVDYFPTKVRTADYASHMVQAHLDFPKVTEKMSVLKTCNGSQYFIQSLFRNFLWAATDDSNEPWKAKELVSEKISFELGNIYCWMSKGAPKGIKHPIKDTEPENMNSATMVGGGRISVNTSTPVLANKGDQCNPDLITHDIPSSDDAMLETRKATSLCSDYFLTAMDDTSTDVGVSQALSSSIYTDYHINSLATFGSASLGSQHNIENNGLLETIESHFSDTVTENEFKVEVYSSAYQKPHYPLAKQGHAFSGALAGICVSLCLHPFDTVKTVIQSCCAKQKSIFYVGKSIVSDRGLPGLYRGIATNIACSAPISAVYTFTYESVKATCLPQLPKEYHSFVHCMAGGCASIATSFIFTPSERIKQQMQVGSRYRNCWDALVGIIRKGGFPSLYAGWGAVLCRNVPHSIIKFYTYERLKQVMSSLPSSIQPKTSQNLVCGGLAGSTAALFTTPFDVIKTRLQTQIPGSADQYESVFHAFCKIGKSEGLKGLYRGLTPRLIMYMSQGSLFFASYEFFKSILSSEAPHPVSFESPA